MEVKVLVVEDHSIVKMGLTAILNKLNVQKVDDVSTCADLMIELGTHDYTHLIYQMGIPWSILKQSMKNTLICQF
jgi:DNA-binding NarL/FixJ family response regulator